MSVKYKYSGLTKELYQRLVSEHAALKDAIGDTLVTIIVQAHQLDLDVTECLGIAYEEIKNRKGKMINDNFVKETKPKNDSVGTV